MRTNYFSYQLSGNNIRKGYFNIYQGRNGGIYILFDATAILLISSQIVQLNLNTKELIDFDEDNFINFYWRFIKLEPREFEVITPEEEYPSPFIKGDITVEVYKKRLIVESKRTIVVIDPVLGTRFYVDLDDTKTKKPYKFLLGTPYDQQISAARDFIDWTDIAFPGMG